VRGGFPRPRPGSWTRSARFPGPRFCGPPRPREITGSWQLAARETWLLPADENSPDLLEKLLFLGDWTLYLAVDPVPPTSLPDCFQSTPLELSDFVESHGIPVLVEAYHDNNPWRLVVEPAAVPGVVAA